MKASTANGPGARAGIWFQGCSLNCAGCFNPATHSHVPRHLVPVESLLDWIEENQTEIEGVTITGGEPLQQSRALLQLLLGVRTSTPCSVVLFSGYTLSEISEIPAGPDVLDNIDVLIAGRFIQASRVHGGLRGSANQKIHLFTGRYGVDQVKASPSGEIVIAADGSVTLSGVSPLDLTILKAHSYDSAPEMALELVLDPGQ